MKWIATALLTCVLPAAASCVDTKNRQAPSSEPTFSAQNGTPQEQFIADSTNSINASFRAAYTTTLKSEHGALHTSTTWYKDGVSRQRFDTEGAYEFLRVDRATIFTIGYKDRIVVCSDQFPAASTDSIAEAAEGSCCEDSSGCGDAAANMLYFLGFPLGYSADDMETAGTADELEGVTITILPQRQIAGLNARCYELRATDPGTDYPDAAFETCFAASGVPLYWHATNGPSGDQEARATSVDSVASDDFDFPYAVYVPTEEPYVETTPVPPRPVTVRLRFSDAADAASIDAALAVIRRRIETGPGCFSGYPIKATDECISTRKDGADYVLSFGVSDIRDRMTDTEITEWLTAQGQGRVRLRFCEALQDGTGRVATVPSEPRQLVVYRPDSCEAMVNEQGQIQTTTDSGLLTWVTPAYADIATAELDSVVWTPALGDLHGESEAMTDAYLQADAHADHPFIEPPDPTVGWRAVFNTTDDGEAILASITARLAPKGKSVADQRRAAEKGYPLAFFLDGQPIKDWAGHVAAVRISRADFPPTLILGLTRDVARRVAQALNGPALQLPVQFISVTQS